MQKKLSLIIILLSSIYFVSQFSRASLGVVVIDIAADLNLNSEQIGRLGGVFFLSFALSASLRLSSICFLRDIMKYFNHNSYTK